MQTAIVFRAGGHNGQMEEGEEPPNPFAIKVHKLFRKDDYYKVVQLEQRRIKSSV